MTHSLRWLYTEIALRMFQKMAIVKLKPHALLIAPDYSGAHAGLLMKRFPKAQIFFSAQANLSIIELGKLRLARHLWSWLKGGGREVELMVSPNLATSSSAANAYGLVWSNLWLQQLSDPKIILAEFWRLLTEGGLLNFSYLGPDTGKELRALESNIKARLGLKALPSAWDMHDIGDALIEQRFADPVMDMEYLDLQYESAQLMLHDAFALGLLAAPIDLQNWQEDKLLLPKKLTLELIYGHAWVVNKHLSKTQNQYAFISPDQIQAKRLKD